MERFADSPAYAVEVDGVSDGQWAEIISSFDDSTIYQTWPWGEVRWGRKNLSHLVVKRGAETVAAAQCWVMKLPVLGLGIAYFKCAPVWQKGDASAGREGLKRAIRALKEEYAGRRGLLLRIMVNSINGGGDDITDVLTEEGFSKCLSSSPYRTIVHELDHAETELRKAVKRQWLTRLKQSEKHPFTLVQGADEALFDRFAAIYSETISRKGFKNDLQLEELRRINHLLPDSCKQTIIMCSLDNEMLSGVLICRAGKTAVIMFSASSARGLELHASQYVWWQTARILKQEGVRWLDLGGIAPEACPGTYQFKKGFAGELGRDTTFEHYDYCTSGSSKAVTLVSDWLRERVKHPGSDSRKAGDGDHADKNSAL